MGIGWLKRASRQEAQAIRALIPEICRRVQAEYDSWDQSGEYGDPELGFGGICQDFADVMAEVLNAHGIEAVTQSASCGEQHVWTVAKLEDGIYMVDIPYSIYEQGGGYNWQKIPGVIFEPSDVVIEQMSPDPNEFGEYTEEY